MLTTLAWVYLVHLARNMAAMGAAAETMGMSMEEHMRMMSPSFSEWTLGHFLFMFSMWAVMMVGMMTPSVAPMVLIYMNIAAQNGARGHVFAPAAWLAGGYLAAWCAFSLVAVFLQWAFEKLALITPMMASASRLFGGVVLIAVGLYQWLPIKQACLSQCRSPLSFIQRYGGFQPSAAGSLRLGFRHGLQCIGCCWAVMVLLFVGGVMNLLWIAALAIFVLLERVIPGAYYFSRVAGLAAVGAGVWLIAT